MCKQYDLLFDLGADLHMSYVSRRSVEASHFFFCTLSFEAYGSFWIIIIQIACWSRIKKKCLFIERVSPKSVCVQSNPQYLLAKHFQLNLGYRFDVEAQVDFPARRLNQDIEIKTPIQRRKMRAHLFIVVNSRNIIMDGDI